MALPLVTSPALLACNGGAGSHGEEIASGSDASDSWAPETQGGTSPADASDSDAPSSPGHPASAAPLLHRLVASPCTEARGAGNLTQCMPEGLGLDGGDGGEGGCSSAQNLVYCQCAGDAYCTAGTDGRCGCVFMPAPYPFVATACSYDGCASDSDCHGTVCMCRETALPGIQSDPARQTLCAIAGNCRVDSDCGSGGYCSPSAAFQCGTSHWDYYGFYCHTPMDECTEDADCSAQGNAFCAYNPAFGHWACSTGTCEDG